MKEEIWKCIPGYEGFYQASTKGNIRSMDRMISSVWRGKSIVRFYKGKMLSPVRRGNYRKVDLWRNQESKTVAVHRLIALTFIENPFNKPEVNHIKGLSDEVSNLEWSTSKENMQHAVRTGLYKHPSVPKGTPFKAAKMVLDLRTGIFYESTVKASKAKNIPSYNIQKRLGSNPRYVNNLDMIYC